MVDSTEAATIEPAAVPSFKPESMVYAWFVVAALCVTNMVSFLERQIVTLMYGPIKADFHVSDTEISLLTGMAFALFAAVFGVYFGRLADRKNRKWIITLGVVAWSFATMSCGLARNFMQLFVARIAVGVGESTLNSSAMSIIADYFPRERLTRALSFYTSSVAIGSGLALFLGGSIIHFVDSLPPLVLPYFGQFSTWQTTFILVGLVGSLVLVPMAFVKEPARRGVLDTSKEAQKKGLPFSMVAAYLKRHWKFYFCHVMAFSLATASAMGILAWTPTFFIRVHGWTPMEIGAAYGGSLMVVGTIGVLLGARVSEWMDSRGYTDTNMRLPAIALFGASIPTVIAYTVPSAGWAIGLIIFAQLIGSLATAPLIAALQLVTPNEMRGQVMAMFSFIAGIIGPAVGPLIVALFTDYLYQDENAVGWSMITAVLILKPIVLGLLLWSLNPYRDGLKEANTRANNVLPASA